MADPVTSTDAMLEAFGDVERFPLPRKCRKGHAGNSQHPLHSPEIGLLFNLTDAEIAAFAERAAIIEYDGCLERTLAEFKARQSVLR